ncbi:cytochrome c-type biogenesis protein [Propionivibrio soli]|uniref:cytochrome c-type biogenesis protein n=1 Tax=Propionivibrio soli TaxID=2976531 RepID=UPI0021E85F01|nr:cytochrome c-type biogenesis protein [Propionivibrio soli]
MTPFVWWSSRADRYSWWLALFAVMASLAVFAPARAKEAAPLAADEAVEKRLVAIASELRCLVCQNESLAGSHAELANDLRREIRTMIGQGRSDREILDFMVSRYGDFVLYRPPLKLTTILLWFGPVVLLLGGLAALVAYLRRRNRQVVAAPLSLEEQGEAERLLNMEGEQQ